MGTQLSIKVKSEKDSSNISHNSYIKEIITKLMRG